MIQTVASKPRLARRHSSTLVKSLEEDESQKKKKKEFVVHNQRHHHRIPSYGRNLNKLNKLQLTPAIDSSKQLPSSFSPRKSSFKQAFKTSHSSGNLARLRSSKTKQRSETLNKKVAPAFQIGDDEYWQEEPTGSQLETSEKPDTLTQSSTNRLQESHENAKNNEKSVRDTTWRIPKVGSSRNDYLLHLTHPEAAPPQLNTENVVANHNINSKPVKSDTCDENSFSPDQYLTSRFLDTSSQLPRSESSQDTKNQLLTSPPSASSLSSQKVHSGVARTRTQQKLLLQKQSSQPNTNSKIYRENEAQHSGSSRYFKELDRVSREFMNAGRFRDIFTETILRVTSNILQSKVQSTPMNAANEMRSAASRTVSRPNSFDETRKPYKDEIAIKINLNGGRVHEMDSILREMWESS